MLASMRRTTMGSMAREDLSEEVTRGSVGLNPTDSDM